MKILSQKLSLDKYDIIKFWKWPWSGSRSRNIFEWNQRQFNWILL